MTRELAPEGAAELPSGPPDSSAAIEVSGLVVQYGDVQAVGGIDFTVAKGELVTLLGPSGCGKTSTLRAIAGLERNSAGTIVIDGRTMSDPARRVFLPPEQRGVGMVFQSYALWPHMTVIDAVAYPLKLRRVRKSERYERATEALATVDMQAYASRRVPELSGGQQQRVAIARALVYEPQIMLLDEPLSNLDYRLRERMRFELKELQSDLGITTVYVTHDQGEALVLSHRIIVMNQGQIEQASPPEDVYNKPLTRFVTEFLGNANILPARVTEPTIEHAPGPRFAGRLKDTPITLIASRDTYEVEARERVYVTIRPENIEVVSIIAEPDADGAAVGENTVDAQVTIAAFLGDHREYQVSYGPYRLLLRTAASFRAAVGDWLRLCLPPEYLVAVPRDPETLQENTPEPGGQPVLTLDVDTSNGSGEAAGQEVTRERP